MSTRSLISYSQKRLRVNKKSIAFQEEPKIEKPEAKVDNDEWRALYNSRKSFIKMGQFLLPGEEFIPPDEYK